MGLRGDETEERFGMANLFNALLSGKMSFSDGLFKLFAQSMQARSSGSLGLRPGEELLAALEVADELGAEIVYGDRDVEETTKRLRQAFSREWRSVLTFNPGEEMQQALMGANGTHDMLERIRAREIVSALRRALDEQAPGIAQALMHERDELMASQLLELSKGGKCILAVVGAAHMDGIERIWLERAGMT